MDVIDTVDPLSCAGRRRERSGEGAASSSGPVIRAPLRALTAARGSRISGTRATTRPARAAAPMTTVPMSTLPSDPAVDVPSRASVTFSTAHPTSAATAETTAILSTGRSVSRVRSEPSRRRRATSPRTQPAT